MKIALAGTHSLLEDIATRHQVTSVNKAEVVVIGGYSNQDFVDFSCVWNKPVLLLSSYKVYVGQNHRNNVTEDDPVSIHPLSDLSFEALNYLYRETLVLKQAKQSLILRVFPVYGHANDTSVIRKFSTAASVGAPIQKFRLGWRTRSFLHVEDFLDGVDAALEGLVKGTTGIYNLGSEEPTTIQEAAVAVWQAYKQPILVEHEEPWIDLPWRPNRCVPSTERFKASFHWEPKITLNKGILQTII